MAQRKVIAIALGAVAVAGAVGLVALRRRRAATAPEQPVPAARPTTRADIVNIARAELGQREGTKYWAEVLAAGQEKPPHTWCGAFLLWVLRVAGVTDWTYDPGGAWFFKLPITRDPKPGDIVFFEDKRHVAMVDSVSADGQRLKLIDGAGTGGAVSTRTVDRSAPSSIVSIGPLVGEA